MSKSAKPKGSSAKSKSSTTGRASATGSSTTSATKDQAAVPVNVSKTEFKSTQPDAPIRVPVADEKNVTPLEVPDVSDNLDPVAQEAEWKHFLEEGSEYFNKERYSVAEVCFKNALTIAERMEQSSTDKDVAKARLTKSLNNLAALYHVQGKYGMAEELYERCLDLKLQMFGEEHLEVAVNLHNLAVLHSAKRAYLKAEILYKRALEIRSKLLGEDHAELVPILRNYALLLRKSNRKEESEKVNERASAIEAAAKA